MVNRAELIVGVERRHSVIKRIPISSLRIGETPRRGGIDDAHVKLLAESGAYSSPLLVDSREMRVIDGRHRLRAAQLCGEEYVTVELVDIPEDLIFACSVEVNARHGLPLSLPDRLHAARRLIASHPHWSDRAISRIAGIAAKTVAAIRRRASDLPSGSRLGLDGRRRPDDPVAGRLRAAETIAAFPAASLREIAARAGLSPATARDVRQRLDRGADPVPEPLRQRGSGPAGAAEPIPIRPQDSSCLSAVNAGRETVVDGLRRDPALRYTESGRAMLRWLTSVVALSQRCDYFASRVPVSCRAGVAEVARSHARDWLMLADRLERRAAACA